MDLPSSLYKIQVNKKSTVSTIMKSGLSLYSKYYTRSPILTLIFISLLFFFIFVLIINIGDTERVLVKDLETRELISQVSEFIAVPDNEIPTILTVSDPERVKKELSLASPQKGDKVIVYPKAGKAILYNVELKKVVEIVAIK